MLVSACLCFHVMSPLPFVSPCAGCGTPEVGPWLSAACLSAPMSCPLLFWQQVKREAREFFLCFSSCIFSGAVSCSYIPVTFQLQIPVANSIYIGGNIRKRVNH